MGSPGKGRMKGFHGGGGPRGLGRTLITAAPCSRWKTRGESTCEVMVINSCVLQNLPFSKCHVIPIVIIRLSIAPNKTYSQSHPIPSHPIPSALPSVSQTPTFPSPQGPIPVYPSRTPRNATSIPFHSVPSTQSLLDGDLLAPVSHSIALAEVDRAQLQKPPSGAPLAAAASLLHGHLGLDRRFRLRRCRIGSAGSGGEREEGHHPPTSGVLC